MLNLTENQEQYINEKYGITDLEIFISEMKRYEEYLSINWPQQHDEAWSNIVNEDNPTED